MHISADVRQIEVVVKILKDYEDLLSDGYDYYCETVDKTLEKMAIHIIKSLNKVT